MRQIRDSVRAEVPPFIKSAPLGEDFAHILLFRCLSCEEPVILFVLDSQGNLEAVDNRAFDVRCKCGWNGNLTAFAAVRHWVERWDRL